MKAYLTKLIDSNWFFISLVGFVVVLPFSHALVSIFGGVVLFTAAVEDRWINKYIRIKERKVLFLLPVIFLIYIVSSIVLYNDGNPFYDLQKTLFFLVLPLAFIFGKNISALQKRFLFYAFALAIFVSSIFAIITWILSSESGSFSVHNIGLVSHIRFSFQLILIFWFFILLIQKNYKTLNRYVIIGFIVLSVYFFSFLIFQQSLTGLLALGGSVIFFLGYLIFQRKKNSRYVLLIAAIAIVSIPSLYINNVIKSFYDIEVVDRNNIEFKTPKGNLYKHDFNNPMVENGKYVYLYVCEKEMREEWNNISKYKYDSIGKNGYPVHSTLVRYLTSKGFRKDAKGISALNTSDIQNIENGMSNVIYSQNKYSLYPRIYQTVWEYYVYSTTGNANYQSFSQRIEFSKAAILIIQDNLWFGVGAGNWQEEFRKAFVKNNSSLNEKLYASSHNQYLNYMVKFGILGFISILFCLIFPVIKTHGYRDPLFVIFLVYLFVANFADSNFESHMGSSFFVFFYCLFLFSKEKKYLEIGSTKTD
ncbi:MAG: O-antigen ligase family protein [Bacteroidetes bacterium]|nr:O-antigen ligase family protein [Bacteroidota bacterium]